MKQRFLLLALFVAAGRYGTFQLPESYLIDAEGVVQQKYIGPRDWGDPGIVSEIRRVIRMVGETS